MGSHFLLANVQARRFREMIQQGMKTMKVCSLQQQQQGLAFRTINLPDQQHFQAAASHSKEPSSGSSIAVSEIISIYDQAQQHANAEHLMQSESVVNDSDTIPSPDHQALGRKCHNRVDDSLVEDQQLSVSLQEFEEKCPPGGIVQLPDDQASGRKCLKVDDSLTEDQELSVSLQEFEEKCPPGGNEAVVVYTTSMRGIRKTFEDCNSVRFLLQSFRVQYNERDVSMHLSYRDELWEIMGRRAVPPRLFIRGRHIGGADEVVGLNERGMLKKLLQGIPLSASNRGCCHGCAGVRFVLCVKCNGSRKIIGSIGSQERRGCCNDERQLPPAMAIRCSECNENGLVKCPLCSFHK